MTPDGFPRFVRLNAFVMLMKTFTLVRDTPPPVRAAPRKKAFEMLKSVVKNAGPRSPNRLPPIGRSLTCVSLLSSLPVVMV